MLIVPAKATAEAPDEAEDDLYQHTKKKLGKDEYGPRERGELKPGWDIVSPPAPVATPGVKRGDAKPSKQGELMDRKG